MYVLIRDGLASMYELKTVYTLGEALKLYSIVQMGKDIERCKSEDMKFEAERRR